MEAVAAGRALIGVPFLAQGRDRARGIDCVGLVLETYAVDPDAMPDDYRLSGDHRAAIAAHLGPRFWRVARTRMRAGDLVLMRVGDRQWHLGMWTGEGLLHADARRRRVVERPGLPEWRIAAVYRARVRRKRVTSWQP